MCGVNRQRAERSRALGPVRPTSDATRAANAAQPTTRRRRRPTHPRNTHERAATRRHQHHHREPRCAATEPHAYVLNAKHKKEAAFIYLFITIFSVFY